MIDEDGTLLRDPDLPDVPTFPEFHVAATGEAATGEASSGFGCELQQNLMNAKVMISEAVMLPPGTTARRVS